MTENILNALHFAAIKHKDQRSYTSGYTDPYINHVIGFMSVLTDVAEETDPILLQAATLQGTIEWTDATLDDTLCDYLKLPVTRILLRTNQNLFLSFSSKFDSQFQA